MAKNDCQTQCDEFETVTIVGHIKQLVMPKETQKSSTQKWKVKDMTKQLTINTDSVCLIWRRRKKQPKRKDT